MGKYSTVTPHKKEARYEVHPIWRGIGCLLLILVPLMALTAAVSLRKANETTHWVAVPPELDKYPDMTKVNRAIPALGPVWTAIDRVYYFDALLFVIFTALGFGLLSVVYSFMYKIVGPPRYGMYDAPEIKGPKPRRSR